MRILSLLVILLLARSAGAEDWNAEVLDAVHAMPKGGGFSATSEASARLRAAAEVANGTLQVRAALAPPSYCSAATYLVLLKVVAHAQEEGMLQINATPLAPAMQRDGEGVWGRWNANGPGTARLFYELGAGRNFTSWDEARPGDFLKLFWRDAVGANEFGHSVIYLGTETKGGVEYVRFWSSNKPGGFGEKSVPKSKVARALFSRLEHPERLAEVARMPQVDTYLASLLERRSNFAEACKLSGVQ